MIEKKIRIGNLYDFYGELLTHKQKSVIELFCIQDFTLAEISEELKISRQAAFDSIKRSEKTLENYENKLGLYEKFTNTREGIEFILNRANDLRKHDNIIEKIETCKILDEIIDMANSVLTQNQED